MNDKNNEDLEKMLKDMEQQPLVFIPNKNELDKELELQRLKNENLRLKMLEKFPPVLVVCIKNLNDLAIEIFNDYFQHLGLKIGVVFIEKQIESIEIVSIFEIDNAGNVSFEKFKKVMKK